MLTAALLLLLRPVTEHTATACAAMLDARSGPVVVCLDQRTVVRWEVRRG